MTQKGDKQVKIIGSDDKRQITVLLCCKKSGKLLLPKVINKGKSTKCHPSVTFPESWNITHSESHWSNEPIRGNKETVAMPCFITIEVCDQTAPAIFVIFKANHSETMLEKLKAKNVKVVFVPPSCIVQLQPLDAIPNKIFKDKLKSIFQTYYSDCVADKVKHNQSVNDIDLHTSAIKPIHAKWLMKAHETRNV
ncbi:hypothetical protein MAR_007662 [Mya arenaria]|uniref:DDE-1 domain-containing protein n=1 Tax=Mya arenaria TaxID=6604 RepID=A0ABY7DVK6_MYAAR|nr:hypothetical protein MAR_007662 [Mya arenaria]